MTLVTIRELTIRFQGPPLLDGVGFRIERGERIGLLGRNGAGKSTLLRIVCGEEEPDGGDVTPAPGTIMSLLTQDMPREIRGRICEVIAGGLPSAPSNEGTSWRNQQRVDRILSLMQLDGEIPFAQLSSGMKRRVLLARALVADPDLLLLDEPTNHLDIDAIDWLERFLNRWDGTLMFVTHDRTFLRKLAGRILELDRGRLFDWSCDYDTFLSRKQIELQAEAKQNALFDKKLAKEEVWIRQGIQARRTRNEGRVRAVERMRTERRQRRATEGKVRMELHQGFRSGNMVVHAEKVWFSYGERPVIRDLTTTIMRGDKIGIIGPNGAGKTTLLQVLLGRLSPSQGSIRLGANLQTAYIDQLRDQLVPDETVQESVADGYESVRVGGKTKHVIGYLQDFLFTPERARTQIRFLSGGERNRILLARLFAKPANVVVLDEPTNDLDAETLELLEELLVNYQGTVLLVSHDRAFLNNVVTSTIVFEKERVKEYVGGYDDWLRQRADTAGADNSSAKECGTRGCQKLANRAGQPRGAAASIRSMRSGRLSYHEQRELAELPIAIERLEAKIDDLHRAMAAPDFYKRAGDEIASETARLRQLEAELAQTYQRWEELDARSL